MPDPFIITVAPNGARRLKTDHPALPITPRELADCAIEVADAGASILHLHVRDQNAGHTLDVDRYRAAIKAIREAVGDALIIQATTEAVGRYTRFEQMDMVRALKPEAVSLALRELCPDDTALDDMIRFTGWMADEHIMPQYILYDEQDYKRFDNYRRQGVFCTLTPFALFVLGRTPEKGISQDQQRQSITALTRGLSIPWTVCGFGIHEHAMIDHAAKNGGHIRVGFENNIWTKTGDLLADHTHMIRLCTGAAHSYARPVANADEVRALLG